MVRRKLGAKRTPLQSSADSATEDMLGKLGRMLKDGRTQRRWLQRQAAAKAGLSRSEWSGLELGKRAATFASMNRAGYALGSTLHAYLAQTSAADLPRDSVHLKIQDLILAQSKGGGWRGLPEELIDREARTSRAADILLYRISPIDGVDECALWDVRDWIDDVGAASRDFSRRLDAVDRYAVSRMRSEDAPLPRTGGCWVVRATTRNRRLVSEHRNFFKARFPGSGHAWLAALTTKTPPIPKDPALIWVSVDGSRLFPARLG